MVCVCEFVCAAAYGGMFNVISLPGRLYHKHERENISFQLNFQRICLLSSYFQSQK